MSCSPFRCSSTRRKLGNPKRKLISHVSVTNKITTHACESAGQQISGKGSDTDINLLISNVGVLNANTDAAGITSKRAVTFSS